MITRWPLKNAMYCHLNDHKCTNETRVNAAKTSNKIWVKHYIVHTTYLTTINIKQITTISNSHDTLLVFLFKRRFYFLLYRSFHFFLFWSFFLLLFWSFFFLFNWTFHFLYWTWTVLAAISIWRWGCRQGSFANKKGPKENAKKYNPTIK